MPLEAQPVFGGIACEFGKSQIRTEECRWHSERACAGCSLATEKAADRSSRSRTDRQSLPRTANFGGRNRTACAAGNSTHRTTISNRHWMRLEIAVTSRKQATGAISNRHKNTGGIACRAGCSLASEKPADRSKRSRTDFDARATCSGGLRMAQAQAGAVGGAAGSEPKAPASRKRRTGLYRCASPSTLFRQSLPPTANSGGRKRTACAAGYSTACPGERNLAEPAFLMCTRCE